MSDPLAIMSLVGVMLAVVAFHLLIATGTVESIKHLTTVKVGVTQRVVVGIYRDAAGTGQNGHFRLSFFSFLVCLCS